MRDALCAGFALALLTLPPGVLAQPQASDPEVLEGIAQVEDGEYGTAILTLDRAARRLSGDPYKTRDLSQAYLYLGIAYFGQGHEAASKANFRDAIRQFRDISLNPELYPPAIINLFEAAREEAGPAPPASATAAPAAVTAAAPEEKQGGSKKVLLLGGAALLVGGGVAVAAGGGDTADSTPPEPPSLTGRWVGMLTELPVPCQSEEEIVMDLVQSGESVTGQITATTVRMLQTGPECSKTVGRTNTATTSSGVRSGDTVTMPFLFPDLGCTAEGCLMTFSGTVAPDQRTMAGDAYIDSLAEMWGPWQATRQ